MAEVTQPNRGVTVEDAAIYAECSTKTIRRRIADGTLPALRGPHGQLRVSLEDLDKLWMKV